MKAFIAFMGLALYGLAADASVGKDGWVIGTVENFTATFVEVRRNEFTTCQYPRALFKEDLRPDARVEINIDDRVESTAPCKRKQSGKKPTLRWVVSSKSNPAPGKQALQPPITAFR